MTLLRYRGEAYYRGDEDKVKMYSDLIKSLVIQNLLCTGWTIAAHLVHNDPDRGGGVTVFPSLSRVE